jgi:murein DD-endopeptidase MepM/ murein hydrolase activator NlpD
MSPAALALLLLMQTGDAPALELWPENPQPGGLVVITLEALAAADRIEGEFDGRALGFFRTESGRWRALYAIPVSRRPGKASLLVRITSAGENLQVIGRPVEISKRVFDSQTLSVDPRFLKPPASERRRIREENRILGRLWRAPATERQWRGSFIRPIEGEIASAFGLRRVFNGRLRSRHYGLDIDAPEGAPVRVIGNGTVVLAADRYYSGGTVIVDHGLKLFSMYFHLSQISVSAGQRVSQGEIIGLVGSTGRATGPHLHLSVKLDDVTFDPLALFEADLSE